MLIFIYKRVCGWFYQIPYTIKKGTPIQKEYNGYKYKVSTDKYTWIPDNWYYTEATDADRKLVDMYVKLIYDAVEYVPDKQTRIRLIIKLTPLSKMPSFEFRQRIIDRFYDVFFDMCAKNWYFLPCFGTPTNYISQNGSSWKQSPHLPPLTNLDTVSVQLQPCDVRSDLVVSKMFGHISYIVQRTEIGVLHRYAKKDFDAFLYFIGDIAYSLL
jgi:hypothetical protein